MIAPTLSIEILPPPPFKPKYRVDTIPLNNSSNEISDENLPQLLAATRGSHMSNIPKFEAEKFISWKLRFVVFLE